MMIAAVADRPATRDRAALILLAGVLLLAAGGCQRAHYRLRADREAYALIGDKAKHPHWALPDYDIAVDPRSRMFDPFDPDYEPMPLDDPASHQYMHCVDCKKGYPHWHADGDTPLVENPDWLSYLPLNEDGVLVLDARTAVELAMLHSRDYQQQQETLYLSALDVAFERFRFDAQFFGGYRADYLVDGGQSQLSTGWWSEYPGNRGNGFGFTKLGTTGSELAVGLANTLVWDFSGPDRYRPNTALNFLFIQPFLQEAGRDKVMERLTLAERTLLANVRQMERWRRGFYVEIVTGRDAGSGPSRRGGVLGAGFEGFTGVGSGGFGGIVGGAAGGGAGVAAGGTGGAQAGGFMGLLQTQQEIENLEDNLSSLRSNHFRLLITLQELLTTIPENSETVVRQRLQVAQAKQAVLNAESRLVNARAAYQTSLDSYKITLGLPPQICVRIEDPMLERVSLVDPKIRPLTRRVSELQEKVGEEILAILPKSENEQLAWDAEVAASLSRLKEHLGEVDLIRGELMDGPQAQIQRVRDDGIKLGQKLQTLLDSAAGSAQGSGPATPAAAAAEADAELIRQALDQVARSDEWLPRLRGFNLVRDEIQDIERLRRELAGEGVLDFDWMRTDANAATRDRYPRYRDAISSLATLAEDERRQAIQRLNVQLLDEARPLEDQVAAVLRDNPWLQQLDRWRIKPDEVEAPGTGDADVQVRRLKRLFVQFVDSLIDLPARFDSLPGTMRGYRDKIDALIADGPQLSPEELIQRFRREISPAIPQELVDLGNSVLELSLVQARDRAETVSLVDVDLHPAAALEIARQNRRDWMNARASLVDAWRLIEFVADDLEGTLRVRINGSLANEGENPFDFTGNASRLQVTPEFDAPITRLGERNAYRQKLIEYQQARRAYYVVQDQIARGLRATLITMQANRRNFEIRRDAVRVADTQIELNEDIRRIQEANRLPSGPTAARDTVSALSDLLTAQNDFLSVWVTYELLRLSLDFDLGTMQLDAEGMWIDPGPLGSEQGYPGIREEDSECWPGPLDGMPCFCAPGMAPGGLAPGLLGEPEAAFSEAPPAEPAGEAEATTDSRQLWRSRHADGVPAVAFSLHGR